MFHKKFVLAFTVATLWLCTSLAGAAAPSIRADHTYFDFKTGLYILEGNVQIEYTERLITADKAKVNLANLEVWGSGNVTLTQSDIHFTGGTVYVIGKKRLAIIDGGVRFKRNGLIIEADKVEFNWRSKLAVFHGHVRVNEQGKTWSADNVTYNVKLNTFIEPS